MKQKGGKMELKKIYNVVENEIQENYKTKVECAKKMGITKQRLHQILNTLKTNRELSFNKVQKILNFFGYEIEIKKRG